MGRERTVARKLHGLLFPAVLGDIAPIDSRCFSAPVAVGVASPAAAAAGHPLHPFSHHASSSPPRFLSL
ncbi:hypothetical protein KFK09_002380 [Dendrobium nobile]|uniref:Uncharacterized protein n=1 Tax=Dendrobium nobile TaxID=94219 RepID=A0A8T3C3P3_DENNO|nr:hypothetical protein KFK09_002380 [Dendrobium nobile]